MVKQSFLGRIFIKSIKYFIDVLWHLFVTISRRQFIIGSYLGLVIIPLIFLVSCGKNFKSQEMETDRYTEPVQEKLNLDQTNNENQIIRNYIELGGDFVVEKYAPSSYEKIKLSDKEYHFFYNQLLVKMPEYSYTAQTKTLALKGVLTFDGGEELGFEMEGVAQGPRVELSVKDPTNVLYGKLKAIALVVAKKHIKNINERSRGGMDNTQAPILAPVYVDLVYMHFDQIFTSRIIPKEVITTFQQRINDGSGSKDNLGSDNQATPGDIPQGGDENKPPSAPPPTAPDAAPPPDASSASPNANVPDNNRIGIQEINFPGTNTNEILELMGVVKPTQESAPPTQTKPDGAPSSAAETSRPPVAVKNAPPTASPPTIPRHKVLPEKVKPPPPSAPAAKIPPIVLDSTSQSGAQTSNVGNSSTSPTGKDETVAPPSAQKPDEVNIPRIRSILYAPNRPVNQAIDHQGRNELRNASNLMIYQQELGDQAGFKVIYPGMEFHYGTYDIVMIIVEAGKWLKSMYNHLFIPVSHISRKDGSLPPNSSHGRGRIPEHKDGRMVDLGYLTTEINTAPFKRVVGSNNKIISQFLVKEQWELLKKINESGILNYIYSDIVIKKALCEHAKSVGEIKNSKENSPGANLLRRILSDPSRLHIDHYHVNILCADPQGTTNFKRHEQCVDLYRTGEPFDDQCNPQPVRFK